MLLNVVGNALYATRTRQRGTGEGYEPTLTISTRIDDQDRVALRVQDNGPGVPPEILKRIFEPFFTTKPTGDGTGLGLSLSHDIVVAGHGGALTVENVDGGGALFTISIPISAEGRGDDQE